jgi:hypothetical protein
MNGDIDAFNDFLVKKFMISNPGMFVQLSWTSVKKKQSEYGKTSAEYIDEMKDYMTHLFYLTSGDGVDHDDIEYIFQKLGIDKSLANIFVGIGSMMKENF